MPAMRLVTSDSNKGAQSIQPKVAIYIRFSTKDQANGWTEEYQMDSCKKLLVKKGWTFDPDMVFVDRGKSAKNTDRPELQRMLKLIDNGQINKVVSWRLDRMFRNAADALTIVEQDWEGKCKLVTEECQFDPESDTGFLSLVMYAAFAQVERKKISERTMAGKLKNLEHGKNPGVMACYGYRSTNGIYEVAPEQAGIIKQIFELSLSMGTTAIAIRLNDQGIKAPNGKEWTPQAVRYILRNRFYIGIRTFGQMRQNPNRYKDKSQPYWLESREYRQVEDFIKPLIDQELFDAAQKAISSRNVNKSATSGRALSSGYLLTGGIAYCGICGRQLSGFKRSDRNLIYYQCRNHRDKGESVCTAALIPLDEADKWVLEHLDKDLLSTDNRQMILDKMLVDNRELIEIKRNLTSRLEQEIKAMERRKNEIVTEFITDPKMSQENFDMAVNRINEVIGTKSRHLETAKVEYDKMMQSIEDTTQMEKYIDEYGQFDKLPIAQQKDLLRKLIVKVIIKAEKGGGRDYTMEVRYPKPE